jgi:triphosphoribosyl-dephospho-CoA synthase
MHRSLLIAGDRQDGAQTLLRSDHLAALATQSLIAEAELTPKPGLVDQRGSGAHNDLSLKVMTKSAIVLEPYFAAIASCSQVRDLDTDLRMELAEIGRAAEQAMFKATQGSNTHKGAIWILGLLVAAAARGEGQSAREIVAVAGSIARLRDRAQPELITHGGIVRNRYGVAGARGEAASDFPHVNQFGLPTLRDRRERKFLKEICRLDALLSVMAELDDTCVLYRGGVEALGAVKSGAQAVLVAGGYGSRNGRQKMRELDRELIRRHISPGGSADLLAATVFLDAVEREQCEVDKDQSEWEARDGAA